MNKAQEFIADMAEQLSMPKVYLDIRALIEQPEAQISDYEDAIASDSMLSVRIIRIANSQFFGIPHRADTLYQAISMIGVIQLHDLLLISLCLRTFAGVPEQIFNLKSFWKYCIECGIAAKVIAQHSAIFSHNHFFTLGLLHEIGHAAMYLKAPEECLKIMDDCASNPYLITTTEQKYLGFDYTQLGETMMRLWDLPSAYQQVANFHLQPELAHESHRLEAQIVHLAHVFCQDQVADKHQALIQRFCEVNHQFNHLPADIDQIVLEATRTHAESLLDMLWPIGSQSDVVDQRI